MWVEWGADMAYKKAQNCFTRCMSQSERITWWGTRRAMYSTRSFLCPNSKQESPRLHSRAFEIESAAHWIALLLSDCEEPKRLVAHEEFQWKALSWHYVCNDVRTFERVWIIFKFRGIVKRIAKWTNHAQSFRSPATKNFHSDVPPNEWIHLSK